MLIYLIALGIRNVLNGLKKANLTPIAVMEVNKLYDRELCNSNLSPLKVTRKENLGARFKSSIERL